MMGTLVQVCAVLALLAVAHTLPTIGGPPPTVVFPRQGDGHVVSDSSAPDSISADSSAEGSRASSEMKESVESEEHFRRPFAFALQSMPKEALHEKHRAEYYKPKNTIYIPSAESEGDAPEAPFEQKRNDEAEVVGQSWERRYRHGVVPARLPAQESDKAHRFRHSIVHGYGDDIHA